MDNAIGMIETRGLVGVIEATDAMLKAAKVKIRRTKTWKECNDPKLRSKKK